MPTGRIMYLNADVNPIAVLRWCFGLKSNFVSLRLRQDGAHDGDPMFVKAKLT